MKQTTSIYTEQEKNFITKACDLLEITMSSVKVDEGISHYDITIEGNNDQFRMLGQLMKYNHEKNF